MRPSHPLVIRRSLRHFLVGFAILTAFAALSPAIRAERQNTMSLFPADTVFFLRTGNAQEFAARMKDSSTGRMLQDPQIKPLIDQIVGQVSQLYTEQAEGEVGITWNDLSNLPKGEVAFGLVARSGASPAPLLIIDEGKEPTVAHTLLERGLELLKAQGGETTKETIDGVEVTVVRQGTNQDNSIGVFERDGTIVASNDPNVLRNVLWHWDGERAVPEVNDAAEGQFVPTATLDTNPKFLAIMRECRRPNDPPPNVVLYADPIEIARQFGRASPGVMFAIALLPQLGLDGVQAIGGSQTISTGQYDNLFHGHILLSNPRAGIMSMIAFDTGDNAPQQWVPADTASYITFRWKFQAFYERLASIVDQFRGQGSFEELVGGRVSERLGVNFKTQVVDNLAGRVTVISGYDKPVTMQSRKQVVAIEVRDEEGAKATVDTILNRFPGLTERRHAGPFTYYAILVPGFDQMPEEQRPMAPFVAVMDKHLFIGTSTKMFEQMVFTMQGDVAKLANSTEYDRVTSTLTRETAGLRPAIFAMSRPDLDIQFWYEMLTGEQGRALIDQAASNNETVERFAKILREGHIPPFEVFKKYLAPAGGILYDTDNGFHGVSFSLRQE